MTLADWTGAAGLVLLLWAAAAAALAVGWARFHAAAPAVGPLPATARTDVPDDGLLQGHAADLCAWDAEMAEQWQTLLRHLALGEPGEAA